MDWAFKHSTPGLLDIDYQSMQFHNIYYLYVLDAITPLDRVSQDVTTYPYHIGKVIYWCNTIDKATRLFKAQISACQG